MSPEVAAAALTAAVWSAIAFVYESRWSLRAAVVFAAQVFATAFALTLLGITLLPVEQ
jgi:hypothetical protein